MDYNVNNENERIIIGEVGENLAESCTIDYSAWVEEYGEGDLRIRAIREGDVEPYPVANVDTADGLATWTYTAADTAVKGFGEVQVLYYVGDVLAKSRVWKTYTYRSLNTSSEEVPDPYADWLNAVERIGGQVEADAEAASASADSASASATLASGSASEAAESALSASRSASTASSSAESAASSESAASQSASEASTYEYYSEQYMNEAKSAKFGAESARTGAENAKAAAQASATAAAQSAAQAEETAESIEASADLIQKLLANQIHDTATGTIATYPDGADMPMVSLVADIDPIQDTSGGAPSPSHICPISGWDSVDVSVCGANVWNEEWEAGAIANSSGQDSSLSDAIRSKGYIAIKPSTQYYAKTPTTIYIRFYGANKDYLGSATSIQNKPSLAFTTPDTASYMRFYVPVSGSVYGNNVSINYPSTITSYEPFVSSDTYHTTLPQTVYGGTLDVVSGVLTVDRAMVDLGTLTWQNHSSGVFWAIVNGKAKGVSNIVCSQYETSQVPGVGNLQNCQIVGENGGYAVYVKDTRFTTDATAFKTAMDGVQLCYTIATPTTITLTPTQIDSLLGRNSVWADSGDVTVEYIADTKLYIQKVIS